MDSVKGAERRNRASIARKLKETRRGIHDREASLQIERKEIVKALGDQKSLLIGARGRNAL
jgi:hypothetical protein